MKLYAPKYYSDFKCIADRCRHSCCIGWEIDIDSDTLESYENINHPYGENIRKSIEDGHFRLAAHDRCPHLKGDGLCRIICELGEGCLCDICREHPRFYNYNSRGCYVGLGLSCEEACRIILSSDLYDEFEAIDEIDEEAEAFDFDAIGKINELYKILSYRSVEYSERLKNIAATYSLPTIFDREILASLEYLEESHKELFLNASDASFNLNTDACERAFAYFIFRHCSSAADEFEFRAALGFALFCENLLRALSASDHDIFEIARIISEELEYSEDNTESIKTEFIF